MSYDIKGDMSSGFDVKGFAQVLQEKYSALCIVRIGIFVFVLVVLGGRGPLGTYELMRSAIHRTFFRKLSDDADNIFETQTMLSLETTTS